MRLLSRKLIHIRRPFANRGASLYAGVGSGPGVDPGPNSVVFRNFRVIPPGLHLRGHAWSINDGINKTARVAHLADPNHSFTYAIPDAWKTRIVYLQVRTHWHDVENSCNPDPYRIDLSSDGSLDAQIHGTGRIINKEKHDGGVYRLRVAYVPATHGVQPTTILIRKSSGPGTLADVTAAYTGQSQLTFDTAALANATTYTFQAYAKSGSVELLLDAITFVADAAGPPAPTGLTLRAT
jgi:hypothetical protein